MGSFKDDFAKGNSDWERSEAWLSDRIAGTRGEVRRVDFLTAFVAALTVGTGFVFLGILLDHQVFSRGLSPIGRLVYFGITLGAVVLVFLWRVFPLFRYRINPLYAAKILEDSDPGLKNGLINWILLSRRRKTSDSSPFPDYSSPKDDPPSPDGTISPEDSTLSEEGNGGPESSIPEIFYRELAVKTADRLGKLPQETVVDHSAMIRWGIAFVVIFALLSLYSIFSTKSPFFSTARILLPMMGIEPPQAVRFLQIEPGDASFYQGKKVEFEAEIAGTRGLPVFLAYSTSDGRKSDLKIPMENSGLNRYSLTFPQEGGLMESFDYQITVGESGRGESRSKAFHLTVKPAISFTVEEVTYHYPAYSGLKPLTVRNQGNLRALEGTRVEMTARSNVPMEHALFLPRFKVAAGLPMTIAKDDPTKAILSLELKTRRNERTGEVEPESPSYQLLCSDREKIRNIEEPENPENGANLYRIEVDPDLPPVVRWEKTPSDSIPIPINGHREIRLIVEDDFGIRDAEIHFEKGEAQGEDSINRTVKKIPPLTLVQNGKGTKGGDFLNEKGPVTLSVDLSPESLGLSVGDRIDFRGVITDSKEPKGNQTESEVQTFIVTNYDPSLPQNEENGEETGDGEQDSATPDKDSRNPESGSETSGEGSESDSGENSGEKGDSGNESSDNPSDQGEKDSNDGTSGNQSGGKSDSGDSSEKPSDGEKNGSESGSEGSSNDSTGEKKDSDGTSGNRSGGENEPSDSDSGGAKNDNGGSDGGVTDGDGQGGEQNAAANSRTDGDSDSSGNGGNGDGQKGDSNKETGGNREKGEENPDSSNSDGKGENGESQKPIDPETNAGDAFETILDLMNEQGISTEPAPDSASPQGRATGISDPSSRKSTPNEPVDPDQLRSVSGKGSEDAPRQQGGDSGEIPKDAQRDYGDVDPDSNRFMATTSENKTGGNGTVPPPDAQITADPNAPSPMGGDSPTEGEKKGAKEAKGDGTNPGDGNFVDLDDQPEATGERPNSSSPRTLPNGMTPPQEGENGGQPEGTGKGNDPNRQGPSPSGQGENPNFSGETTQSGGGPSSKGTPTNEEADRADRANLEFTEKTTSLVLEYLEDQLKDSRGVDPELLRRLGWTEDELRAFAQRWQEMKERGKSLSDKDPEKKDYLDTLRDLGLRPESPKDRLTAERKGDEFRTDSKNAGNVRTKPPREFQERFRLYHQGLSRGSEENPPSR